MTARLIIIAAAALLAWPTSARAPFMPADDAPAAGMPLLSPNGEPRASLASMRAYRISQLSDDEIRHRRKLAEVEFARLKAEAAEQYRAYMANYDSECQKVNTDIVYRARNPSACKELSSPKSYPNKTVDQIFDEYVLEGCDRGYTVSLAIQIGCLPADPIIHPNGTRG